ncbi:MAG TPA: hypothetical protein VN667_21670 [Burkholderiales bacterium]|nr:hypothetical protein [Burkholderiales bacterium]
MSYIENGVDPVEAECDQWPEDVLAELLTIVIYLRDTPADDWIRPDYAPLQGKLDPLGELRVITVEVGQAVHYRILGFMNDSALEFTMLAAGRKTRRFSYAEIGALALKRMANVKSHPQRYSHQAEWMTDE